MSKTPLKEIKFSDETTFGLATVLCKGVEFTLSIFKEELEEEEFERIRKKVNEELLTVMSQYSEESELRNGNWRLEE